MLTNLYAYRHRSSLRSAQSSAHLNPPYRKRLFSSPTQRRSKYFTHGSESASGLDVRVYWFSFRVRSYYPGVHLTSHGIRMYRLNWLTAEMVFDFSLAAVLLILTHVKMDSTTLFSSCKKVNILMCRKIYYRMVQQGILVLLGTIARPASCSAPDVVTTLGEIKLLFPGRPTKPYVHIILYDFCRCLPLFGGIYSFRECGRLSQPSWHLGALYYILWTEKTHQNVFIISSTKPHRFW